jgi:Asp-tRNA(Asn)/Glu-tRNA(Gln) amidotransferase A subunit family amidase
VALDRSPGGSSSGSAPRGAWASSRDARNRGQRDPGCTAWCGAVGLADLGRVSRDGVFPLAASLIMWVDRRASRT